MLLYGMIGAIGAHLFANSCKFSFGFDNLDSKFSKCKHYKLVELNGISRDGGEAAGKVKEHFTSETCHITQMTDVTCVTNVSRPIVNEYVAQNCISRCKKMFNYNYGKFVQ